MRHHGGGGGRLQRGHRGSGEGHAGPGAWEGVCGPSWEGGVALRAGLGGWSCLLSSFPWICTLIELPRGPCTLLQPPYPMSGSCLQLNAHLIHPAFQEVLVVHQARNAGW